jgi:hypothetical protein
MEEIFNNFFKDQEIDPRDNLDDFINKYLYKHGNISSIEFDKLNNVYINGTKISDIKNIPNLIGNVSILDTNDGEKLKRFLDVYIGKGYLHNKIYVLYRRT